MILAAFRRGHHNRNINALYGAIVAQARSRAFYANFGVPDTVEGRFELIVLHLVLVLRRLAPTNQAGGRGNSLGQRLFDVFCHDLDDNLREMGVGDMAVPRKMRQFGEAFYGRQTAYNAAMNAGDEQKLEKALARNIFGIAAVDGKVERLAHYVRATARWLDAEEEKDILAAGKAVFPRPEGFAHAST
jgi:cytochrome b pre-mRNA-processing protein 3